MCRPFAGEFTQRGCDLVQDFWPLPANRDLAATGHLPIIVFMAMMGLA
ncbi:hypothetical protein CA85_40520 [Allorhodopirellula solitaria]|uniref:Uncharacterized protein n=1 Tax=Allorhodopirellula solitaria TaxID=2527987 RepID=A0A5C5X1N8_9BACT|nr:hypothetical protein CA85_40520 [Allorhodopirellula solitaria]